MGTEPVQLSDMCAQTLFAEVRKMEQKTGIPIEEILIRIIYESEDDRARVDAMRVYHAIMFYSNPDMGELMEGPNLADVFSIRGEG